MMRLYSLQRLDEKAVHTILADRRLIKAIRHCTMLRLLIIHPSMVCSFKAFKVRKRGGADSRFFRIDSTRLLRLDLDSDGLLGCASHIDPLFGEESRSWLGICDSSLRRLKEVSD
jgi:hypothetical protein